MLPGSRTSGLGTWRRSGHDRFEATSEAFILFGPTFRPWWQRISQQIELTGRNEFAARARVEFGLVEGTLPPSAAPLPAEPLCANAVGFRF